MRLSHLDYQRLNESIAVLYRMAFTSGGLKAIAQLLPHAVGGLFASVVRLNKQGGFAYALSHDVKLPNSEEILEALQDHPRIIEGKAGNVTKVSDFVSRASWHQKDLYQASLPYVKHEDDLGVDIALPDGGLLQACVIRDSRTFREEDREIFSLLLPHFISLLTPPVQHATTLAGLGLTRREQEVLHWVTEGKTNSEVAGILHIASGTVKIHLERIYEKLGVVNRHGAARRALEVMHPDRFEKGLGFDAA